MKGGVNTSSRYKALGGEIARPGLGVREEKGGGLVGTVALYSLGRVTEATMGLFAMAPCGGRSPEPHLWAFMALI